MDKSFRLYLTGVLIFFAILISFAVGFIDYQKGQKQIRSNHEKEIDLIEESVMQSLHTINQVYSITEEETAHKINDNLSSLAEEYKKNPMVKKWNYEEIKNHFDMDFYVIDETNTVIHSSFENDIGLNFTKCCGSFTDVITNRRLSGEFRYDNLDIEQVTGQVKIFGYLPTHDQKYLFQMSTSLEEDRVFQSFNFLEVIERLVKEYEPVQSIRIYGPNGIALRHLNNNGPVYKISEEMRPIFNETKNKSEKQEISRVENNSNITYRYIPYVSGEDSDYPLERVVEIVYNEVELESILKFYRNDFFIQQIVIVFSVILLAIVIGRMLSKPIHLAFHDNLTNMKNRAAFEIELTRQLEKNQKNLALMMIDVDNFKQVNDRLGHAAGDRLLVSIAKIVEKKISMEQMAARLGGDEFVVIIPQSKNNKIKQLASHLIEKSNETYRELNELHQINVSISIGIAYAKENEKLKTLYERADAALYRAKENGKNQYYLNENDSPSSIGMIETFHQNTK